VTPGFEIFPAVQRPSVTSAKDDRATYSPVDRRNTRSLWIRV